ncbi:LytTR family transcriptional regulator DNA-binding domain-containing protein [Paenibacillus sp. P2(2022)]|uniref:HTH LytTR-type domain-containing protein n=1 Tax=Paenibacillus polymyxa TaxID=1406 RepID=A0A378Y008_PAEPO|nr:MULTISPECIES: LytTR family transcriptional regulator DNA-binding domain-containing protein [Paenibacillus]MBE7901034.1 LytTR family transcriptional regulator DNA-binding domain-containing protein [Paenibacillus polymyxa]MBG9765035.1 hypothetical protein [Paenibacillus polymyxa]MBY7736247.1 LytTR family transcriptional regulator DNA-binding domain-containing protein [Paenibacillus polymyxa]MCC3261613.1 LytTR family transcriptional regulator DNA-binding domain-containing protein [Paenibacillus
MLSLTVSADPGGIERGENVLVDKVLFISKGRKRDQILVHTFDRTYYMVGTLRHWENFLNSNGYRFLNVDRSNTLNVEKVKIVNGIFKDAYFEDEVTKTSKRCPIAYHRFDEVVEEMGFINSKIIFTGVATK